MHLDILIVPVTAWEIKSFRFRSKLLFLRRQRIVRVYTKLSF